MTRYTIARSRGVTTSICEACGDMSPAERIDRRVFEWQRKHTAAHRAQEGRRTAPASVPAPGRDASPQPTPTHVRPENAPQKPKQESAS